MTQAQTDELTFHLDEQHDALLQRLDDLDAKIAAVLEEWAEVAKPIRVDSSQSALSGKQK